MVRSFKNLFSILLATIVLASTVLTTIPTSVKAANTTYYVDSIAGNDSNNGTSASTPWQSLTKVNSVTFQPGDKILLKAGSSWSGQQLKPNGSGGLGNPITLDKYGTGNLPLISGAGVPLYAVHMYNVQHWEINNIEVTNLGASALAHRTGIVVECRDMGVCNHIYVKNVYVHDVNGLPNKNSGGDFDEGGIFYTVSGNTVPTKFNDVLIDRATVKNVDRSGIMVGGSHWGGQYNGHGGRYPQSVIDTYSHTNVIVRNSYVENAGGDAILVLYGKAPLIEYNVSNKAASKAASVGSVAAAIWAWRGVDAVLQYNEAYNTVDNNDGQAWDADYGLRTVYQYNYSHDNPKSVMFCWPESVDSVFRYNISQNDYFFFDSANQPSGYIYNNVIYTGPGRQSHIFRYNDGRAAFNNNIFYNLGTNRNPNWHDSRHTYSNNLYFGYDTFPNDANKITVDPMFVNPGSGGIGINTVDGYKLQATSPAINAGIPIPNNGGKDFWGNPLTAGKPDIGAFEYHAGMQYKNPYVRIEAESFDVNSGTIVGGSSEGGQELGYIDNGDYTVYNNVDFGSGARSLEARVASDTTGGTIEVRLDSPTGTLVGTCAAPGTGGWQTYTNISCNISGATGVHNLYLKYSGGFNFNHFRFVSIRSAFSQIEAEDFDVNSGTNPEISSEGGQNLGYIDNGDYTVYHNIDFGGSEAKSLEARVAGAGTGGTMEVRLDSLTGTLVGTCVFAGTGGWQTYTTQSCNISGVTGIHNVYLKYTAGINLNWFKFAPAKSAFSQIEAENFDFKSGTIPENSSEGGQNLGFIHGGDYTVYNNIDFGSGAASLTVRVASGYSGGNIEIRLDSPTGTLVGTCVAPGTGGWQTYTNISCSISGATGIHNLYLKYMGGTNLFNLNWFKFSAAIINDTDTAFSYTGSFSYFNNRGLGDFMNDVHGTTTNNDYFQYTFTGTGVDYIGPKNSDEGNQDVYIDNVLMQTVSGYATSYTPKSVLYSIRNLGYGTHTIKVVKKSGTWMLVDGIEIIN